MKPRGSSGPTLELRPIVNGKPTLRPSSWPGWKTRAWSQRLFGAAICGTSTRNPFVVWWTSSLRDSRASRTASPGSRLETATDEAGATGTGPLSTSCGSSKRVSPPWCSSKMSQLGLWADTSGQSERNYADWVTRSRTRCSLLRKMWAQRISGSGCSSWPTARAEKLASPRSNAMTGPDHCDRDGSVTIQTQASAWPTPAARDYRGENGQAHHLDQLPNFVKFRYSPQVPATPPYGSESSPTAPTLRRRLNPAFVCWLMGWPWWWTRAEPISCAAAEMALWRCRLRSRLWSCFPELNHHE